MINSDKQYAVGIDIGGTSTKLGLVDSSGHVTELHRMPTDAQGINRSAYLDELAETTSDLARNVPGELIGVGMSILGPQNAKRTGTYLSANAPGLVGVNFRSLIADKLNVPIIINNDLTSHTLAESHFGNGRGVRRFMCVGLGTGVGVGMIVDSKAINLWGGTLGDCGRVIVDPASNVVCGGGVKGSAEALCGVSNIEHMAHERYGQPTRAFDVITAAREGTDAIAVEIIQTVGRHLGVLISSLYSIFFPDVISLTGGVAEAGTVLLQACREQFDMFTGNFMQMIHQAAPDQHEELQILLGQVKGESGIIGSVVELFNIDL